MSNNEEDSEDGDFPEINDSDSSDDDADSEDGVRSQCARTSHKTVLLSWLFADVLFRPARRNFRRSFWTWTLKNWRSGHLPNSREKRQRTQ